MKKIYHREIDETTAREFSYRIAELPEHLCTDFAREDLFVNKVDRCLRRGEWTTVVQPNHGSDSSGNDVDISFGFDILRTYDVVSVLGAVGFLVGTHTSFFLTRVSEEQFSLTLYCDAPELLGERWGWLLDMFPSAPNPEAVFDVEKLIGNAS